MKAKGWGRIVNIASAHALVASPYKSAYVAAKHGIAGLTKTVALETAEHGITVNAVCPGYVLTPLVEKQIPEQAKARGIPRRLCSRRAACRPKDQAIRQCLGACRTRVFLAPMRRDPSPAHLAGRRRLDRALTRKLCVSRIFSTAIDADGRPKLSDGPYRFVDREYMVITYETDPEVIREQLPEPLEPVDRPLVHYEWINMPDSSGFGSYTESGMVIPVPLPRRRGQFRLADVSRR